jgi:hypothetical protein
LCQAEVFFVISNNSSLADASLGPRAPLGTAVKTQDDALIPLPLLDADHIAGSTFSQPSILRL